eukprot:2793569-Ditylum_brightwellii.AAC.1
MERPDTNTHTGLQQARGRSSIKTSHKYSNCGREHARHDVKTGIPLGGIQHPHTGTTKNRLVSIEFGK